ncbi:MAG: hypothetical protein ABWZ64_07620, partial [Xanthobacteraceae bacterium]
PDHHRLRGSATAPAASLISSIVAGRRPCWPRRQAAAASEARFWMSSGNFCVDSPCHIRCVSLHLNEDGAALAHAVALADALERQR